MIFLSFFKPSLRIAVRLLPLPSGLVSALVAAIFLPNPPARRGSEFCPTMGAATFLRLLGWPSFVEITISTFFGTKYLSPVVGLNYRAATLTSPDVFWICLSIPPALISKERLSAIRGAILRPQVKRVKRFRTLFTQLLSLVVHDGLLADNY